LLDSSTASLARINAAVEDNMVAKMSYFHSHHPGMHVDQRPDLVVIDSGLPCDTFNQICRARLAPGDASGRIAGAIGYFHRVGRPFSWWVGPGYEPANLPDLLRAAGLNGAESEIAMAMDLRKLAAPQVPAGLRIERVVTPAQFEDFASIEAANWDPPDPWVIAFYRSVRELALDPQSPCRFYVGYAAGDAVAASECWLAGGVAGIFGVATRVSARRRGFGTALTARPLHDARAAGYLTGVLQASDDGKGVYARIGFVPTGQFIEFR
jgi:hypothetical protein